MHELELHGIHVQAHITAHVFRASMRSLTLILMFCFSNSYRKRLKAQEEGVTITPSIVPPLPPSEITPAVAPNDSKLPPGVSPELVLFCRKIYDFRSKKIQVPNK